MTSNGVYLDTSILRFAKDLRGIHQVVFQMVEVLANEPQFKGTGFIAAEGTYEAFLRPLGVRRESMVEMPTIGGIGRFERFHGLMSTYRYAKALKEKPRLIIHPELRTVLRGNIPQVIFYHDTMELDSPSKGRRKWDRWLYYRYKSAVAAKVAFKLANSEYTKKQILSRFVNIKPSTVSVAHLGVRKGLEPKSIPRHDILKPLKCIYVGSYEARKNIPCLIANFIKIASNKGMVLHLAGNADLETEDKIKRQISLLGISSQVIWHGLISDEELASLYGQSHLLLFPSLKEGFGLPLVEAMAHGLVVLAFHNSAIPEVVGDAGILAADNDFQAWETRISRLLENPREYSELTAKSLKRAEYFRPERAYGRFREYFSSVFLHLGIGDS